MAGIKKYNIGGYGSGFSDPSSLGYGNSPYSWGSTTYGPNIAGTPLDQQYNQFTSYKPGAFSNLYRIRYIDISNNNLNQTAVDQLLSDLFDNWSDYNRGGVTINLRGNDTPSEEGLEYVTILRSKGWSITLS